MISKVKQFYRAVPFLLLVLVSHSFSQLKTHQIGRLWQTMFPVGSLPDYSPLYNGMTYPGGDFFLGKRKNMEATGLWIGVRNWANKFGQFKSYYVSEGGYMNHEASDILEPVKNKKYVRQRLPLVDVNDSREQRILDNRDSGIRKTSIKSDEKVITTWRTDVGVEVVRTSYAFANRRHDGYIIEDYKFTNTGNVDGSRKVELLNQTFRMCISDFGERLFPPVTLAMD